MSGSITAGSESDASKKPLLLFIEGPKGAGKSTLVDNLCKLLVSGITEEHVTVERFRHARPAPEVFADPIARNLSFASQRALFCAGLRGRTGPSIVVCDRWNHSAIAAAEYLFDTNDGMREAYILSTVEAERRSTGDWMNGDLSGRRLSLILSRSEGDLQSIAEAREVPRTAEDKHAADWYRRYDPKPYDHGPMHKLNVDLYSPAALAAIAAQYALDAAGITHFINMEPR